MAAAQAKIRQYKERKEAVARAQEKIRRYKERNDSINARLAAYEERLKRKRTSKPNPFAGRYRRADEGVPSSSDRNKIYKKSGADYESDEESYSSADEEL